MGLNESEIQNGTNELNSKFVLQIGVIRLAAERVFYNFIWPNSC